MHQVQQRPQRDAGTCETQVSLSPPEHTEWLDATRDTCQYESQKCPNLAQCVRCCGAAIRSRSRVKRTRREALLNDANDPKLSSARSASTIEILWIISWASRPRT